MSDLSSYELTDFNLQGHIKLGEKLGLVKLMRSEDGRLILVAEDNYERVNATEPIPNRVSKIDDILATVLDIGIRREKRLTFSGGFYFGTKLTQVQSNKVVEEKDLDLGLMEDMDSKLQAYYQSGDTLREIAAVKLSNLLEAYNNARLLFPSFHNESYLGLMRVLDALASVRGSCDFAVFVALASPALNTAIHGKILAIEGYADRIKISEQIYTEWLAKANAQKWSCKDKMAAFSGPDRFVFSCFLSAYQYRNMFVHNGMPFPWTVIDTWGLGNDSGTAYLHPALGTSFSKVFRPTGYQEGDSLDIHCIVPDPKEEKAFKDQYFLLLPTWHFLKTVTRSTLISAITSLNA